MKKYYFIILGIIFIVPSLLLLPSCRKWENPYDENNKITFSVSIDNDVVRTYTYDIVLNSSANLYVKLQLYKGENKIMDITTDSVLCKNKFSLNIPWSLTPGSDYRIKAISASNSDFFEFSNYFTITNWENYSSVPVSSKFSLFIENFNDDSNGWASGTTSDYTTSFNGYYNITNNCTSPYFFWNDSHISDFSKNFQFELSMKYTGGDNSSFLGFFWNYQDVNNYTEFLFWYLPNNGCLYGNDVSNTFTNIQVQPTCSYINNGFNNIVIRKIDGYYYFFANGSYLFSTPYETVSNNDCGFEVWPSTTAEIDYLYVYYLEGL